MSFKKSETPPALPSDEVMKTAFASMDYVSLCELYSFLEHQLYLIDCAIQSKIVESLSKAIDEFLCSNKEDLN